MGGDGVDRCAGDDCRRCGRGDGGHGFAERHHDLRAVGGTRVSRRRIDALRERCRERCGYFLAAVVARLKRHRDIGLGRFAPAGDLHRHFVAAVRIGIVRRLEVLQRPEGEHAAGGQIELAAVLTARNRPGQVVVPGIRRDRLQCRHQRTVLRREHGRRRHDPQQGIGARDLYIFKMEAIVGAVCSMPTLAQSKLRAGAVDIVQPDWAHAERVDIFMVDSPFRIAELTTRNGDFRGPEVVVAHCPPSTVVEYLQPARMFGPVREPDRFDRGRLHQGERDAQGLKRRTPEPGLRIGGRLNPVVSHRKLLALDLSTVIAVERERYPVLRLRYRRRPRELETHAADSIGGGDVRPYPELARRVVIQIDDQIVGERVQVHVHVHVHVHVIDRVHQGEPRELSRRSVRRAGAGKRNNRHRGWNRKQHCAQQTDGRPGSVDTRRHSDVPP